MTQPYRIVVGYDYSSTAELALHRAFALAAREEQGEVHVVHVLAYVGDYVSIGLDGFSTGVAGPMRETAQALEARAVQLMAEWQEATHDTFSRLVTHVRYEYPAREIAQLAMDLEAQLVVMGTHGRRGFNHFLMGSVAEGVIRLARCPVLVIRPTETKGEVPAILPPCPQCLEARKATAGAEFWCEQHRERHGQRHTYHYQSRVAQPADAVLAVR